MFNGTQSIPIQISNRFQQFQTLEALTTTLNSLNNPEMELFLRIQNKLLGSYVPTKKIIKVEGMTLIGSGKRYTLSLEHLSIVAHLNLENHGLFFSRFLLKNDLFTIASYKVNARRKNCFVMTEDETLFQISACLLLKHTVTRSYVPLILGCPLDCIVQVPNVCKK